ncbi:MAG TPA: PDZ domain-containing protein [Opitutaceae bacterium]
MLSTAFVRAADLHALWAERAKSVVAVEFFTESELDRRPTVAYGTVIDDQGTIILPAPAVGARTTPEQLKDFRVYRPGQSTTNYAVGEYLGQDGFTGWHFVRVAGDARAGLVPVTAFAAPQGPTVPQITDEVWGIGLRGKDEDFTPYFLTGRVGIIQTIPQRTAVTTLEIASPGLPVFDRAGGFIGLGATGFGQSYVMFSQRDRGGAPILLMSTDECSAFQLAEEVLPYLGRIPKNVSGRPLPWLGAHGLQPVDPEVAKFFELEDQAGLVVSEVLEGSPAEKAGLQERDILLALDGRPLPRLKPDRVVVTYVDREIDRRLPGDPIVLTVLRGKERIDVKGSLAEAPPTPREAERRYFDKFGLTLRAFVYADGVSRRVKLAGHAGVIAHFVKSNGPAGAAGLRTDDWIKEIDGVEVKTFAEATEKLAAIEADPLRNEFVLLASRGGETAVLRVKLN